jgi:hypothetical protein
MNQEQINKVEKSIKNLKDKKSKIYLLIQDTKGHAKASIAYSYRLGMTLSKQGYNMVILHEKSDYTGVSEWLGGEYMELPHQAIEGQNLEVSPEDFIIVPELYGFVMSQITKLPCGKIVLCQSYDHILETLQPGQTWAQLGFYKCITTSETQKEYISNIMRGISIEIIPPYISEEFKSQTLPPKPMIAIHSREQRDTANIIKSFYIKFPQYRWITFRDMKGLTEKQFAEALQDCFLSVWVDETSSFGTFPLESMKSNVPVLGLVPNLAPLWMNDDNGLWINNKNQMVDFIADFLQNWLEDNVNEKMYESMSITANETISKTDFEKSVVTLFDGFLQTRLNSFEEQLNKLEPAE